jgi:hypothetical protein
MRVAGRAIGGGQIPTWCLVQIWGHPAFIARAVRKTSTTMEIVRSVRLAEIDPAFFETSYYVVPDRGDEKAYAILFRALQETGPSPSGKRQGESRTAGASGPCEKLDSPVSLHCPVTDSPGTNIGGRIALAELPGWWWSFTCRIAWQLCQSPEPLWQDLVGS